MNFYIEICNLRNARQVEPFDVIADRRTPFGNPFKGAREHVCNLYEDYFYEQIKKSFEFRKELDKLFNILIEYRQLRLFCWCYPERCHTETIKKYLLKHIGGC